MPNGEGDGQPRPRLSQRGPSVTFVEGIVFTGFLSVDEPLKWVSNSCYCSDQMQENPLLMFFIIPKNKIK